MLFHIDTPQETLIKLIKKNLPETFAPLIKYNENSASLQKKKKITGDVPNLEFTFNLAYSDDKTVTGIAKNIAHAVEKLLALFLANNEINKHLSTSRNDDKSIKVFKSNNEQYCTFTILFYDASFVPTETAFNPAHVSNINYEICNYLSTVDLECLEKMITLIPKSVMKSSKDYKLCGIRLIRKDQIQSERDLANLELKFYHARKAIILDWSKRAGGIYDVTAYKQAFSQLLQDMEDEDDVVDDGANKPHYVRSDDDDESEYLILELTNKIYKLFFSPQWKQFKQTVQDNLEKGYIERTTFCKMLGAVKPDRLKGYELTYVPREEVAPAVTPIPTESEQMTAVNKEALQHQDSAIEIQGSSLQLASKAPSTTYVRQPAPSTSFKTRLKKIQQDNATEKKPDTCTIQ